MNVFIVVHLVLLFTFRLFAQPAPFVNFCITFIILILIRMLCGFYFSIIGKETPLNNDYYSILITLFIYSFLHFAIYAIPVMPEFAGVKRISLEILYINGLLLAAFTNRYYVQFYKLRKISRKALNIAIWVSFAFFAAIILTNRFTQIVFIIEPSGEITYPDTYLVGDMYPIIWFVAHTVGILGAGHSKKIRQALFSYIYFAIFFVLFDATVSVFSMFYVFEYITAGSLFALGPLLSMYYIFFSIIVNNTLELKEQEKELTEKKTQIMISQIQPHFLFNTLSSIYQLCEDDSELAQKTIKDFSLYLRNNMNAMNSSSPVPFEKELDHIKTYLSIEKLRFGDILNVEYNIECMDFLVPALSVQPIVENAVKYGVRSRANGGTVYISTCRKDNKVYITVRDDGNGFDVNAVNNDGRTHVGIENSRSRIEMMCSGTLKVESKIGSGTTATIILEDKNEPVVGR